MIRDELEEINSDMLHDAALLRKLKAQIKGLKTFIGNGGSTAWGTGTQQKLSGIWRQIQAEADMEKGDA